MNKNKKDFKMDDIIIPTRLLFEKRINFNEIYLFGIIQLIELQNGACYTDNKRLAKEMKKSESTISRYISKLKIKGYIFDNGKYNQYRELKINPAYKFNPDKDSIINKNLKDYYT